VQRCTVVGNPGGSMGLGPNSFLGGYLGFLRKCRGTFFVFIAFYVAFSLIITSNPKQSKKKEEKLLCFVALLNEQEKGKLEKYGLKKQVL
jgi:hypothetical protein